MATLAAHCLFLRAHSCPASRPNWVAASHCSDSAFGLAPAVEHLLLGTVASSLLRRMAFLATVATTIPWTTRETAAHHWNTSGRTGLKSLTHPWVPPSNVISNKCSGPEASMTAPVRNTAAA